MLASLGKDSKITTKNMLKYPVENMDIKRLVQDGRVEGSALTPSCESTGITTNCWTIIDRKTLELTKKNTPHPKTKKPQWDGRRGAITIKSNPITAGWVTHKLENTYTTEVHPLEWRFWAPRLASQPSIKEPVLSIFLKNCFHPITPVHNSSVPPHCLRNKIHTL